MEHAVTIFLGLSIVGALAVTACRIYVKRRFVSGRQPMDLERLFDVDVRGRGITYETLRRVYEALGRSFSLDTRLIRPSDSLRDILALDSWGLWIGQERMEKWLADNFEVSETAVPPATVMDLLRLAQDSPPRRP
jgi:hypothetical protein